MCLVSFVNYFNTLITKAHYNEELAEAVAQVINKIFSKTVGTTSLLTTEELDNNFMVKDFFDAVLKKVSDSSDGVCRRELSRLSVVAGEKSGEKSEASFTFLTLSKHF